MALHAGTSGFRYCITAIDRFTRWPEAFPLSDITAEAVAKAFVSVWVARFGCPQQFTTDQSRQFEARLFNTLANSTGSSLTQTAWHSASNFLIERPPTAEGRPDVSCRLTMGRGSAIGPVGYSQYLKRGLKSLISQTSVCFSTAVTGRVLRPFTQRIYRRHQLRLPSKGTN